MSGGGGGERRAMFCKYHSEEVIARRKILLPCPKMSNVHATSRWFSHPNQSNRKSQVGAVILSRPSCKAMAVGIEW
eukprot:4391034-Amphidinium_carterae.1